MKRLVVGLAVLGVIVAFSIAGIFYTDSTVDDILTSLDRAAEVLTQDLNGSARLCEEANKKFEDNERLFSLFLNHRLLEEIKEELAGLSDYATKNTKAVFLSALERTKTKLIGLKDSQKHIF